MKEIRLYKNPIKSLRLLLLSSLFVIPSIWFIVNEKETKFIFWFCVCFFGIGFLISVFNILDRRVQIIITEVGIWDRSINQELIKWEFIQNAYDIEIHKQVFISIKTDERFVMKKKIYKWANNLNQKIGAQKINLNLSYIKVDLEKMITFINIMKTERIEEREKLIELYRNRIK
ncbi:hypothetical protein EKL98_12545 [Flavobacterium bomense]|uniref:Uncharacterized protein n=1 Tax=Flavobacterium bomense TaxID=2497483 RepID=A0A432CK54_9FLAO|nr:STM3941 family protein [Flavobacterium bomense]RTZ02689.1 hypothetical protein EKL98_12545 [Flavobacterium bomense]